MEAIPQAVAGLLKLGQPRFVIYAYGQALKPKDIYFGPDQQFQPLHQLPDHRRVCHPHRLPCCRRPRRRQPENPGGQLQHPPRRLNLSLCARLFHFTFLRLALNCLRTVEVRDASKTQILVFA